MAELLSDREIRGILGSIIKDGSETSIRPNSYVLRLGATGEYLTTNKEFHLGEGSGNKKGIKVPPGESVALTALEAIDFRREAVNKHFPDHDLHALISPTTDLQREGVVAPTTHVDAGYHGTLNWTLSNSSNEERRFIYKERLFRLAIFKLSKGERPDKLYDGSYQGKEGYVRSERSGAPVGMRPTDWEDSTTDEGPQALLNRVIQSGFPWNALGTRLKTIDDQFKSVTNEYADIRDSIGRLEHDIENVRTAQGNMNDQVRQTIREELAQGAVTDRMRKVVRDEQYRWLAATVSTLVGLVCAGLSIFNSELMVKFLSDHGGWLGPTTAVAAFFFTWLLLRRR